MYISLSDYLSNAAIAMKYVFPISVYQGEGERAIYLSVSLSFLYFYLYNFIISVYIYIYNYLFDSLLLNSRVKIKQVLNIFSALDLMLSIKNFIKNIVLCCFYETSIKILRLISNAPPPFCYFAAKFKR